MRWIVVVSVLGLGGCGPTVLEGNTEEEPSTSSPSSSSSPSTSPNTSTTFTTSGPSTTTTTTTTAADTSDTSDESSTTISFITEPDGCFAGGTPVATPQGERAIETLKVGDAVYAYDVEAGVRVVSHVEARFEHPATAVLSLTLGDQTLRVTGNHPIYQPSTGRYVRADRVESGDVMLAWHGTDAHEQTVAVTGLGDVRVPVYNISVAGQHNYFAAGVLVHNKTFYECDIWAQDCPRGEKCVPWSNDGGDLWNARRCTPIAEDPGQPGDACTVDGSFVSGVDDCEFSSLCWDVDPDTLEGTCIAMCTGDEAGPMCPDADTCVIANDGDLPVCLPPCDPIMPTACTKDEQCLVINEDPVCTASIAGIFTPCVDALCEAGQTCVAEMTVPDCGAEICCTPWCDLNEPDPDLPCAAAPMTVCQPYYSPGEGPAGLGHLGVCTLPA